ncbi:hypothetical protein KIPB_009071, partial [Kipferlia bialata]
EILGAQMDETVMWEQLQSRLEMASFVQCFSQDHQDFHVAVSRLLTPDPRIHSPLTRQTMPQFKCMLAFLKGTGQHFNALAYFEDDCFRKNVKDDVRDAYLLVYQQYLTSLAENAKTPAEILSLETKEETSIYSHFIGRLLVDVFARSDQSWGVFKRIFTSQRNVEPNVAYRCVSYVDGLLNRYRADRFHITDVFSTDPAHLDVQIRVEMLKVDIFRHYFHLLRAKLTEGGQGGDKEKQLRTRKEPRFRNLQRKLTDAYSALLYFLEARMNTQLK